MASIDVDWEVRKALINLRESETVTDNDVLRQLLKLDRRKDEHSKSAATERKRDDWIVKGVRFPAGTEFRAMHKGQDYSGKVEGGFLVIKGEKYYSPSAAAVSITDYPVNGWNFWKCRLPGSDSWKSIDAFRRQG